MKYKLDIMHRLKSLLQEDLVEVYILKSALDELKKIGEKGETAYNWALNCCTKIDDSRVSGETAIDRAVEVVRAAKSQSPPRHYFVATQDQDLRHAMERVPGVPLLYLNKVTLVLSDISRASLNYNSQAEELKASLSAEEESAVSKLTTRGSKAKPELITEEEGIAIQSRPKKKAVAPNPLASLSSNNQSRNSKKKKLGKYRKH